MADLSLYLVTDRAMSKGCNIAWIVEEAVIGGVTMVQLREKACSTREFINLATQLKKILCKYNVPLIINDRADVALASGADGLHIGQSDMPWSMARKILGPGKIIGLSVENIDQVRDANNMDVDYIAISPVFSTDTKTDTNTPFGLEGITRVMATTKHPAVAIGGITISNTESIIRAGVNGVAVVSAICSADNPRQAATDLKNKIKTMHNEATGNR